MSFLSCRYPTVMDTLHVVKILDPGHSRSGHQVTSSDFTSEKVWMLVIASSNGQSPWNFQRLISVTVSIKCISRNLYISGPASGQFCDFSIISQWEKFETHLFWTKTIRNAHKRQVTGRLDILNRNIATSNPSSCRHGHFRWWKVTSSFSAIHFDKDKLEQ